ncbi:MAG TPA: Spi family protease inhibitor, partial [Lentimicrobium sp.]|nr:Spi family protease inhibitor [Lentimicrobium sp.]
MSTIKTLMLTILFSWAVIQVTAKPVSPETATQVAVNFLKEKISQGSFPAGTQANFSMIILSGKHQQASMYVFNLMDNAGFIIVSGNDATYPVLCYANHGCFSMQEKERPGGFSYMLDEYTRLLDALEEGGIPMNEKTSAEWAHYLHG